MHIETINGRAPKALNIIVLGASFLSQKAKPFAARFEAGNGYSGYDLDNRSNNFPCFECSVIRGWLADQGQPRKSVKVSLTLLRVHLIAMMLMLCYHLLELAGAL